MTTAELLAFAKETYRNLPLFADVDDHGNVVVASSREMAFTGRRVVKTEAEVLALLDLPRTLTPRDQRIR